MRLPQQLKKGDKIGLSCTARKISLKELQPAIEIIHSWGYEVVLGQSIGLSSNQFAGTDEDRAKDLQLFLDDPSIKAIMGCRGGYGTVKNNGSPKL